MIEKIYSKMHSTSPANIHQGIKNLISNFLKRLKLYQLEHIKTKYEFSTCHVFEKVQFF